MKLLLIAYSFPPSQDPQSIRWYFIANALAELGAKIDVLTIKRPYKAEEWSFHKNINIFKAFAGPIGTNLMKIKERLGVENSHNRELRKNFLFKLSKTLYRYAVKLMNMMLPGDIRSEWFFYAIKEIRASMTLKMFDYIITSHEPAVDSLIGLYLKKKQKSIRWVADFGDPYVAPLYTPFFKLWFEKRFEKTIYRNADLLIFTSQAVIKNISFTHPYLNEEKLLLLEQGFSYSFSKSLTRNVFKEPVFTLVYTGTFYKNFRDPSNFIKALSALSFDYKFILAGRNEEFLNKFNPLGSKFQYVGLLQYFETLCLQKSADVLVHISNSNSIQFPGKFYEYLGSGKPILSIIQLPDDPSIQIIESLGYGVVCRDHPEEIKDAINELYKKCFSKDFLKSVELERMYDYSWERKAEILWDQLTSNIDRGFITPVNQGS